MTHSNHPVGRTPYRRDEPRSPTIETSIDRIAPPNLGVITIEHLRDDGISEARRKRALRRGGLITIRRGVYRSTGSTLSRPAELRAVCSAIGSHAVASHRSALWLWDLIDDPQLVEVTVPIRHAPDLPGVLIHRTTDPIDPYRFVRHAVPTTTPARALLDAAGVLSPHELSRAAEQALIDRLVTVAGLRRILDDLARKGRRGAGPLRHFLDTRALDDKRPESQLEPLMARLCRDHGVGKVHFQVPIVLDGVTYRPDFQISDVNLAVEVDGLDTHRSRNAFDADLTRQNAFIRNDWLMLRYTSSHLRRPAAVAREIIGVAKSRLDGVATASLQD